MWHFTVTKLYWFLIVDVPFVNGTADFATGEDCAHPFTILQKDYVNFDPGIYNDDFIFIDSENLGEQIKSICDE